MNDEKAWKEKEEMSKKEYLRQDIQQTVAEMKYRETRRIWEIIEPMEKDSIGIAVNAYALGRLEERADMMKKQAKAGAK